MIIKKFITFVDMHYKKIFVLFLLIYVFYLLCNFGLLQKNILSCFDNPKIYIDYAIHYASSVESSFFLKTHGRIWGYNPCCSAGFLSGFFLNLSNHWAIFFQFLLSSFFNSAFVFNLSVFLAFLILPILSFFTAKNFGMTRMNSLFFFIFSIFFITGFNETINFLIGGLYSFALAVFLSFYVSSIFFKYTSQKKNFDLVKLAFFGGLAFFVHPLSVIICLALCIPRLLFYFKNFDFKDFYKLGLCLIIIILLNLLWILPLIRFSDFITALHPYYQTQAASFFSILKTAHPFTLIFILFLLCAYTNFKNKISYTFLGSAFSSFVLFFIISFFGSQIGLPTSFYPARFMTPLALLSILVIFKSIKIKSLKINIIIVPLILFLLALLVIQSVNFVILQPFEFNCGYPQNSKAETLLSFIKNNLTEDSRIHVQNSFDMNKPYFETDSNDIIYHMTSKQILAGSFKYPQTKFGFTQFINDTIFEKKLGEISNKELQEYLELYNVKYFLVFSEEAHTFFNKNEEFKKIFGLDSFSIYEYLHSDESFCYKCKAIVKSDYDRIVVENASSNVIILKYHYIDTLKVMPESLTIGPVWILDDPVPFIRVENGNIQNFIVYN